MVTVLWLHVPALFIFGYVQHPSVLHVLAECLILVASALTASLPVWRSRAVPMLATTFGLLTASALLVHFSGGVIEMHFHFFVIVAAVTLYQAWMPFLFAIAYVVGQHGVIGVLDASSVYNHPAAVANPWKWALIHGSFIMGVCIVLLLAWRLNEEARDRAEESQRLQLTEERARRDAQVRYAQIFENAIEGIYETTPDGSFVAVNPSVARILGYGSVEELTGTKAQDHYSDPADRATFLRMLEESDVVAAFEFKACRKDGTTVWLSNNARAVRDEDGELTAIQGTIEDITERKEAESARRDLEDQLRQAQKMEAVGQLAGGVAHDFNNLLSIISNFTNFVYEELEVDDPKAQDLREVLQASERGATLVRQLLAFSRSDVVEPHVINVNDAVNSLMKILQRALGEHIHFDSQFDDDLWRVEMDAGHLDQIVMNLAVNARDAMPDGGSLVVKTSNVQISSASGEVPLPTGRYVCLTVEDSGCGMRPEVSHRIFEPFFTTKERGAGTGLGLATVYGIVQHWKGHITVDSAVGRGTRFKIYFPAVLAEAEAADTPTVKADEAGGTQTILVVEDERQVLDLVCRILRAKDYEVLPATSPAEARIVFEKMQDKIELLLTDVIMPGGSGTELAAELVQRKPSLKKLFMSGYTGDMIVSHGLSADEAQFLQKPFSATELLAAVQRAFKTMGLQHSA